MSHWQSLSDWSTAGLSFVIAKASEGGVPDAMYGPHITKGRRAGLVVGAYCFNRADLPIGYQVDTFIRAAGAVDLYAIDVEEENIGGTQKFSVAQARDFMARFRLRTGKPIGLYISESPYLSGGYSRSGFDWLWIAHYGVPAPTVVQNWDFHQYRGSPLDLDHFNGTAADLARLAKIPTAPDSGLPEDAMLLTDVTAKPGTATIKEDGPVWRVADDARVEVKAGASWECVGTARYHHTPTDPEGDPGYLIRARAPDGELHVVAQSRCSFVPAPVDCTAPIAAAIKADRAKAYVAYKP